MLLSYCYYFSWHLHIICPIAILYKPPICITHYSNCFHCSPPTLRLWASVWLLSVAPSCNAWRTLEQLLTDIIWIGHSVMPLSIAPLNKISCQFSLLLLSDRHICYHEIKKHECVFSLMKWKKYSLTGIENCVRCLETWISVTSSER